MLETNLEKMRPERPAAMPTAEDYLEADRASQMEAPDRWPESTKEVDEAKSNLLDERSEPEEAEQFNQARVSTVKQAIDQAMERAGPTFFDQTMNQQGRINETAAIEISGKLVQDILSADQTNLTDQEKEWLNRYAKVMVLMGAQDRVNLKRTATKKRAA